MEEGEAGPNLVVTSKKTITKPGLEAETTPTRKSTGGASTKEVTDGGGVRLEEVMAGDKDYASGGDGILPTA